MKRMKLKKFLALFFSVLLICCFGACSKQSNQDARLPQSNKVTVVMGYSLDQLGLRLSDDSNLSCQQMKYNDQVDVNGNYTEVYQTTGNKGSLMILQGFDKRALEQGEIYLNGRTFSQSKLSSSLVYETSDVAVYDISYYVLSGSLEDRLQQCNVTDLVAADSVRNIGTKIEVKNSVRPTPQKPEKAQQGSTTITM